MHGTSDNGRGVASMTLTNLDKTIPYHNLGVKMAVNTKSLH